MKLNSVQTWNSVRLVLRPTAVSIYKDQEETQLRHQIKLEDITAVAVRKDKKDRDCHTGLFDLYTAARNFHLEAKSVDKAKEWVESIRREARMNEENASEPVQTGTAIAAARPVIRLSHSISSSPESRAHHNTTLFTGQQAQLQDPTRMFESHDPSATDVGSFSDFSDEPMSGSVGNLPVRTRYRAHSVMSSSASISDVQNLEDRPELQEGATSRRPFYMLDAISEDERIICHGFLRCLKTRGVRQWKKYWVVLRGRSLALYKSEEVRGEHHDEGQ